MVPLDDLTPEGLLARFKEEASKIGCYVYHLPEADTIARILELIGDNRQILAWDFRHIALPGLSEALAAKGISVAAPADGGVKVGITGADAVLSSAAAEANTAPRPCCQTSIWPSSVSVRYAPTSKSGSANSGRSVSPPSLSPAIR
jgi:hypothetical protein